MLLFDNLLLNVNFSEALPIFGKLLLSLVIIPVVVLVVVGFCGRLVQRLFSYDFGPRFQVLIGGIGAMLHELFQLGTALITGHSLRNTHSVVLGCIRRGSSLENIDHYWDSHNILQETGDFFVGILPLYLLSGVILLWQSLLCGNPFTEEIRNIPLDTYLHPGAILSIMGTDFWTSFSGAGLMFVIFLIGIIELASSGYNFSANESKYTMRGLVFWSIIQVFLALIILFSGLAPMVLAWVTVIANYGVFIMMRAIFYLIVIAILLLPFALINKVSSFHHMVH